MDNKLPPNDIEGLVADLDVSTFVSRCEGSSYQVSRTVEQVGYYSVDGEMQFKSNDSELKYLKQPTKKRNLNWDLNLAAGEAEKWIDENNIDNLLRWILLNVQNLMDDRTRRMLNVDFICSRGLLQTVMHTPYERSTGWIVCATRFAQNIYLARFRTEEEKKDVLKRTDQERLTSSGGKKFEQYMTSDSPTSLPEDPNLPVNERRGFYSVLRTSVERFPVLVSAEMDALKPEFESQHKVGTSSTAGYVELKTSQIADEIRLKMNLHKKMSTWWAHTHIVGVPTVICGYRDKKGIVRQVKEYKTEDLPRIAEGAWKPEPCMKFLLGFLNLVDKYVVKDDPRVVYKFNWDPKKPIQENLIQYVELEEAGDYRFVKDWYIDEIKAHHDRQEDKRLSEKGNKGAEK